MTYTGYSVPSIGIINQIQTLLKERYKEGFPIVKEIIQNANDGGATNLHIALVESDSLDAAHPLLRRPAIAFINDGDFDDKDERAILWFGADLNAGDTSKVGKFGLGQKSVFHFCEAFFYVSRSSTGKEYSAFVNPWAKQDPISGVWQDTKRPDWSGLSNSDRDLISQYLQNNHLIQKNQQFFALWIPLRQEEDLNRCILPNTYQDIETIKRYLPEKVDIKIAAILPMLKSLVSVSYWIPQHKQLAKQFCLRRQGDGISISDANTNRYFCGSLSRDDTDSNFTEYIGSELKLENQELAIIRHSPYWPQRLSEDDNGNPKTFADKADSHCAVVLSRTVKTGQRGKLTIQWAVFLPVADDEQGIAEFEEIEHDCEWDYTLLLHGYFFLDSGRRYIEFLKEISNLSTDISNDINIENSKEIAKLWNQILVTEGTLPQVVKVLDSFIKDLQLSAQEISHLCTAITNSFLWRSKTFRNSICRKYQYIYRIQKDKSQWKLESPDCQLRSLPIIPVNIWKTFPKLEQYASQYCLILKDESNLVALNNTSAWNAEEICEILNSIEPRDFFSNSENLEFLKDFLNQEQIGTTNQETVRESLLKLLKESIVIVSIDKLQNKAFLASLKELVQFISSEKRFLVKDVGMSIETATFIFKELNCLQIEVLFIYKTLDPKKNDSKAVLNRDQLIKVIEKLIDLLGKDVKFDPPIYDLIEQMIVEIDSCDFILDTFCEKLIFRGYNSRKKEKCIYNYLQLKEARDKYLLFTGKYDTNIVNATNEAISKCELIFIDESLANIFNKVLETKKIDSFTINHCKYLLSQKPNLSNSQNRISLLSELIRGGN